MRTYGDLLRELRPSWAAVETEIVRSEPSAPCFQVEAKGALPLLRRSLELVLHWKAGEALLQAGRPLDPSVEEELQLRLGAMLSERRRGRPWEYIWGETFFFGRAFQVTEATLIPRADSEILVEEALRWAPTLEERPLRLGDFCTGSGCLGLTVALELEEAGRVWEKVHLLDLSSAALAIARENARRLAPSLPLSFQEADLLREEELGGPYDLLLMNPPYVTEAEYGTLSREVRCFEPKLALSDGGDGLAFYRSLFRRRPSSLLREGGYLLLEHGYRQRRALLRLVEETNYEVAGLREDYGQQDRVLVLRWSGAVGAGTYYRT